MEGHATVDRCGTYDDGVSLAQQLAKMKINWYGKKAIYLKNKPLENGRGIETCEGQFG